MSTLLRPLPSSASTCRLQLPPESRPLYLTLLAVCYLDVSGLYERKRGGIGKENVARFQVSVHDTHLVDSTHRVT